MTVVDMLTRRDPLARIASARAELERSRDLAEIGAIRDFAVLAREYARAKKLGQDAVDFATEIVNRAERRHGEVLAETPKTPGPGRGKTSPRAEDVLTPRQQAGEKLSSRSQQLAELPADVFEANVAKPTSRLARIARDIRSQKRRDDQPPPAAPAGVDIRHGDFRDVLADLTDVDAVITDPPYARAFLPLLADLAAWSDKVLAVDGILAVLFGQAHLPEVYRLLDGHRPYRWTMAYLTPGAGYPAMHARIQSHWKPVLLYGGGPRSDDTVRCADASGNHDHQWQQSLNGFTSLVERLTTSGQTVADPFLGAGTTAVACKSLRRGFVGCDTDPEAVAATRRRLA